MGTLGHDLRTVPGTILRTPLLWIPFVMLLVSFVLAVLLTQGTTNADGTFTSSVFPTGVESLVSLYVQLTLPPTAIWVFMLAGGLAGRTGYLVGAIAGLFDGILWSLLFVLSPTAQVTTAGSTTPNARVTSIVDFLAIILVAVVVGFIVGGISGGIVHLIRRSSAQQPVAWQGQIQTDAALVRTYPGHSEAEVRAQYSVDAAQLAPLGYAPVAEAWAVPATPGGQGSLTVSYGFTPMTPGPGLSSETVTTDKTCPRCAESVKSAALVCRFCGYEFSSS